MKRGGKTLALAFIGVAAVVAIIAVAVVLSHGVEKGTVIELTISGPIMEERDTSLYGKLFQGDVTLTHELTDVLDKAARDESVAGIMAVIKPFSAGPATIEELRGAIEAFHDSGKWSVAYVEGAGEFNQGTMTYWLASAFDELTMPPAGDVNLVGIMATVPFLRGVLDHLGVYPDVHHIGAYKSAKDLYTEKKFTPAHREATEAWVGDIYESIVEGIASSRGWTTDAVKALIDRGPFTGEEALKEGLIDKLAYYDEFREAVKDRAGGHLTTLDWREYADRRSGFGEGTHKIAVIHATGAVVRGRSGYDPGAGFLLGSETITKAIRQARKDRSIEGIILRVDSPGGSALASDVIWRETDIARKEKPVVASYGDLAASGGYYLSCSADRIIAEPSTLTGSIGVVFGKMVTKGLFDWLGFSFEEVQRGKNAGLWSELHRWTPEEEKNYTEKFLKVVYDRFVQHVADGRDMSTEAVDKVGQGRVWTGRRAVEIGLVDELGGFDAAVRAVKKLAKIPEDEGVRLVDLPEKEPWWRSLWGGAETVARPPETARMVLRELRPVAIASIFNGEPALISPAALSLDLP
ncbi:MAG TPA: signal peptide peptidase SppA [Candidatus Saccharimonadales bacterium]|nr:signal peptide peptidase SppA [Candidatus Saccharimonadales bacterium]